MPPPPLPTARKPRPLPLPPRRTPARSGPPTGWDPGGAHLTGRLKMPSHVHAHLDLLLLALIRRGPHDADSARRELRERFGARSAPSAQVVYSMLSYLKRNRLIRPHPADPHRYLLTTSGQRSLDMKTREWQSFARGAQSLVEGADGQVRGRGV